MWIAINKDDTKIAIAFFLSTIAKDYYYLFALELCGILLILITIDYFLIRYTHPFTIITVEVGIDC